VEENTGALGSILAEVVIETRYPGRIKRLSLGDRYLMGATDREQAARRLGIDAESIAETVRSM
jgi:transketolase C-terminal domain/subunit